MSFLTHLASCLLIVKTSNLCRIPKFRLIINIYKRKTKWRREKRTAYSLNEMCYGVERKQMKSKVSVDSDLWMLLFTD